jgi:RimJ/RimL family protein N-acetyltransferase
VLKSARIGLFPLRSIDAPVLLEWINDRDQVLRNAPYKPVSESAHYAWFEAVQKRTDMTMFGIRVLETDKLIGTCQLRGIDSVHRNAELQIRIGDVGSRGVGYGTEAVRLLLEFAFVDLNLHRVFLHAFATNVAAIRVYEKVGFVREGVLRQAAHINGEYVDVMVMGVLRNEYAGT